MSRIDLPPIDDKPASVFFLTTSGPPYPKYSAIPPAVVTGSPNGFTAGTADCAKVLKNCAVGFYPSSSAVKL